MSGSPLVVFVGDGETTPARASQLETAAPSLSVVAPGGPRDARTTVRRRDVDCVVIEATSPERPGISLLRSLRNSHPESELPVVMFVSGGDEALASAAVSADVTEYVRADAAEEPIERLVDRVRRAIRATAPSSDGPPATAYADDRTAGSGPVENDDGAGSSGPVGNDEAGSHPTAENDVAIEVVGGDRTAAAPQVVPGIEGELADRERQLARLHEATRDLVTAADAENVAETVLEAAQEVLGFQVSGVRLAREGRLEPVAISPGRREELGPAPTYSVDDDAPPAQAYRGGETLVLADVEPALDDQDRSDLESAAFLPLDEYGTLSVATAEARELTGADLRMLEILAANAAVALGRLEQRRQVEERERVLQRERNKLAALFQNAADPTIEYAYADGDPIVQQVNGPFERVFGFEADEAVGRHVDELVVPPDRTEAADRIDDRIRDGERVDVEVRRRTASGELREFRLRTIPVESAADNRGYAVYTDITRRKTREQRLQVLNRVLRHNLRNDMNVIMGTAELVEAQLGESALSAELAELREVGERLLDRSNLARTIEETLTDPDDHATVDLAAVVDEEAAALAGRAPSAAVRTDLPAAAPTSAGPNVRVAVRELLDNAVEHNDGDRPTVEVALSARNVDGRPMVVATVADDGPGIPEHERAVLLEGSETQLRHGSGLGLWLVRWIVQAAGGWVAIDDREGGGSSVSMYLPSADREAD